MAIDAERVAECQRDQTITGVGDLCRVAKGLLRLWAIVEVSLHVEHFAGFNRVGIDVGRAQQRRHTEVRVHRSLCIGRDHDDAPAGGCSVGRGSWAELHTDGAAVVTEHPAQFVVADLADVRRRAPERGDATHRVGRRAATHLDRAAQRLVDLQRPVGVDQGHRALHQVVASDECIVGMSNHIDQGIADPDDVIPNPRHVGAGYRPQSPRYAP